MKLSSILACAAGIMCLAFSSCGGSSSPSFDKVDLIPVTTSKTGKWSMVNSKGEIVYDSEFKNQPTAAYNGLFSVKESKGFTVYKIGGKSPEAVNGLENLKDVGYLEDGLMPVTFPGKRIALVDVYGETQFELNPTKGVEITCCAPGFSDGMLWFGTDDDKYGFVDKTGKIIIQPTYKDVSNYSEGLAVVTKVNDNNNSDKTVLIIDKSGKEVFKLKDGYELVTRNFKHGYIVARNDGRFYLFNKKGEEKKLSAKIASVYDYNGKNIIYRDEDGDVGVMDFDDNIIIRPKYNFIAFGLGNFFIAKKESDSKELVKIDTNGEESSEKIDYNSVAALGKFGYIAQEGKTAVMLNDKFTKKGKEEFFDINMSWDRGTVYSNYLDIPGVAETVVNMIDGNKVGYLTLGTPASLVFGSRSPNNYSTWQTVYSIEDMAHKGFLYNISASCHFNRSVVDIYITSRYDLAYKLDPYSKIEYISLKLYTQSDWGKKGQEALKRALEANGFTLIKDGKNNDAYSSLYKKGSVLVVASSEMDGLSATLDVYDDVDGDRAANLSANIHDLDGSETALRERSNSDEWINDCDSDSFVVQDVPWVEEVYPN